MNANPTIEFTSDDVDIDFEWDQSVLALFAVYDAAEEAIEWEMEQRHEADRLKRDLRIVYSGKCPECKMKAPDVAATKAQATAWFTSRDTSLFMKYQVAALEEGLHRECIPAYRMRQAEKQQIAERKAARKAEREAKAAETARAEAREKVIERTKGRKIRRNSTRIIKAAS